MSYKISDVQANLESCQYNIKEWIKIEFTYCCFFFNKSFILNLSALT